MKESRPELGDRGLSSKSILGTGTTHTGCDFYKPLVEIKNILTRYYEFIANQSYSQNTFLEIIIILYLQKDYLVVTKSSPISFYFVKNLFFIKLWTYCFDRSVHECLLIKHMHP